MNVTKIEVPQLPGLTGTRYHYVIDDATCGGLIWAPKVSGTVRLADGTVYDLTPEYVPYLVGHDGPLAHHIDRMLEESGALNVAPSPDNPAGFTFTHVCSDRCGAEAVTPPAVSAEPAPVTVQ